MRHEQAFPCLSLALATTGLITSSSVLAGEVNGLINFNPNTPAKAAEVNGNFGAVKTAVDDNDARIAALEQTIATLQTRIAALENNSVLALDGVLSLVNDPYNEGRPTARFTGVNLQVVSAGVPYQTNGLGNLIIGFNNVTNPREFCSEGQYSDSVNCIGNLHTWGANQRSGSHNLIVGNGNSYTNVGSIIAGLWNINTGVYNSVLGGTDNMTIGNQSAILGGSRNESFGSSSTVSGGDTNATFGTFSSVIGGSGNTAFGSRSTVSGGANNEASNAWSSVSGGRSNKASGNYSTVSGGSQNEASGDRSSVSGGSNRTATGQYNWRAGSLLENN